MIVAPSFLNFVGSGTQVVVVIFESGNPPESFNFCEASILLQLFDDLIEIVLFTDEKHAVAGHIRTIQSGVKISDPDG